MTTRKNAINSSTPSGPVRVRAESNVIGMRRGDEATVERTAFVDAMLANGHFVLTESQPTPAEHHDEPLADDTKGSA